MSLVSVPAPPMIPVLDERLVSPGDATRDHKFKIESYNDLLEDIYHRELELSKLKAGLIDMRAIIVEEAQTLDNNGTPIVPGPATELGGVPSESTDAAASESDGGISSDNSLTEKGPKGAMKKRRGSKGKFKCKGREKVRISGEEMGQNWDYNVRSSRRTHLRRASDASESDLE
ncbi:hypothetical protein FA15DRAFT_618808 [Coprinopsis marcescibilis]|uniref:Uncharacterized protein n=1 Tax=Coprinopsis marcescibilis TaxID=230819 RepID=A0A5C3KYF5_COPMA|nr:hypothetical protein FA15DRAFT_618808 [Coprinopsis marcescibilis]